MITLKEMSKHLGILATFCSLLFLTACGDDNDSSPSLTKGVRNLVAAGDLIERTWESDCYEESKFFGVSSKSRFEFKGSAFKEVVSLFEDGKCKDLGGDITYEGAFEVKRNQLNDETKDIKLTYNKVIAKPTTEGIVKTLNMTKLCDHTDWALGKELDLTSTSADILCPVKKTPNTKYNLILIEDEKLFFGEKESDSEQDRSITVDHRKPFHKI